MGEALGFAARARALRLEKEMQLLYRVLAAPRDAESACAAIERFAEQLIAGGQWLKVAAGGKATVLENCARIAPEGDVLEVGTYVGYSALRIASAVPAKVLSLEVSAAHAVIAREVIAHANMSDRIEVVIGHSEDILPQLQGEVFGAVFFDQRGSRYLADLIALEEYRLLR